MKTRTAALLGIVLLAAGCGTGRTQADQDKDGRMLASALRAADLSGASFNLTQQLVLTGGDIPSGQEFQLQASATGGQLKNGAARFSYRINQGKQKTSFDMLVADGRLYVKHQGSGWKTTPVTSTTTLFPALRLDLVRESVLLATSVSAGAVTHVSAGFARKYVVMAAPDQLEQLESLPVQGTVEEQFLKTASAELDVYVTVPGGTLARVDAHLIGTDPSNGEKQDIQSTLDLSSAKVAAIQAPTDAQQVDPSSILN